MRSEITTINNGQEIRKSLMRHISLLISIPNILCIVCVAVMTLYLKKDMMHVISYYTSDRPPLPFTQYSKQWGDHFFGDYAMNYWIGRSSSFSIDTMYGTPWFPAAYLFLQPFTILGYSEGFYVFIGVAIAGIVGTVRHALRASDNSEKLSVGFLAIFLSAPVLCSFDRGNEVVFLLPIVYLYLVSLSQNKKLSSYFLLALAVGLKPHLLPLILLLDFKWRSPLVLIKAALAVFAFQVIGFLFSAQNPFERISHVLSSANRISSESVFANSRSFSSMVAGIGYFLPEQWEVEKFAFSYRNAFSLFFLLFTVFLLFTRAKHVPLRIRALLICGLIPFVLPFSPPYNSVIMLAVLLFACWESAQDYLVRDGRYWNAVLVFVVAFHVIPIPFEYRPGISFAALLSPISYILFLVVLITRHKRKPTTYNSVKVKICAILVLLSVITTFVFVKNSKQIIIDSALSASVVDYSQQHTICDVLSQENGKIEIAFTAKQYEIGTYQDFFQTDDLNLGIRIEREPSGTVSLIIAQIDGTFVGTGVALDSRQLALFGKATIKSTGEYSLVVNGVSNKGRAAIFRPSCDHLLVGQGFNSERRWKGESKVQVSSGHESKMPKISLVLLMLLIARIVTFSLDKSRDDIADV